MDYITVGEIVKAQGIKGEVKVKPLTDDPERFKKLKIVYIGETPYRIESIRIDGFVYIKLLGINDRNAAEKLTGRTLDIDRVLAKPLEDEYTFYIADVESAALMTDDGERVGTISEVSQYGAADVFTVACVDGRTMRFPFLKKLLVHMDSDSKVFTVKREELEKVAVYED